MTIAITFSRQNEVGSRARTTYLVLRKSRTRCRPLESKALYFSGVYCLTAAFKFRKVKKTPNYLRLFCCYS